ncbi:MAG TPA: tetratricopeptide repeat protein [Gammaproteobacteria bacterium]|nr:tetratricopeptide repeat protein [Gammaproteobacteria bacterium]
MALSGLWAADRQAQTGTHLESRAARPVSLQINESSVVHEVQRLLDAGDSEAAVALARRHVDSFERTQHISFEESMPARYFALNALCVALTGHKQPDAAADACTEAIALVPNRWTAINNRGTARYIARRYGEALSDYRRALRLAPADNEGIVATLEHNIALAVARQQAVQDER